MKKLFVVLLIVLALPVVASMVGSRHQAQAFNSVAVAGHVNVGGQPTGQYCTPCGCSHSNCVCDPGEEAGPCPEEKPEVMLIAATPANDAGAGLLLALVGIGFTLRIIRRK